MNKRVVIVQRVLPHYREALFTLLRELLEENQIELDLVVGQPAPWEASKKYEGSLPWVHTIKNRYFKFGKRHIVWQPAWGLTRGADLVVVEQASSLLINYPLLFSRLFGGPRIASWGHGRNLNPGTRSRFGESIKRRLLGMSDWWFAYTTGTADLLQAAGVPARQITALQNAIDTKSLADLRAAVSFDQSAALRQQLGIGDQAKVGIVLGSIYAEKRPAFMVESADLIRDAIPDFHLIVIGDGPLRSVFDTAAATRPWIHAVGPKTGPALAGYAACSSVMLNPGLVGLSVLDSFALRLPMVTCALSYHSPEIEYLEDGRNGLILPSEASSADFALATVGILSDPVAHYQLKTGCMESAERYSVAAMASNFSQGICAALELPPLSAE